MKSRLSQILKFSLLGLIITTFPVITSAADSVKVADGKALTVKYADLDLTASKGVKVLYQRLKNAANQVCGVRTGSRDVFSVAVVKEQCVKNALSQAIESINNDSLNALYYSNNGSRQES